MKKIYLMLFVMFSTWQINSQVLNQSAGWPNASWTVAGTYNTNPLAFEADPTTTANFAFDDDDAGNPSEDNITVTSPVIDLTPAFTASETLIKVSVQYGYRYLAPDILRFEYWNADTSTWVIWGGNLPGNNTTVTDNFCTIPKTTFTTPILNVSSFTPTQLSGFKYRIFYDDDIAGSGWNWGFCFNSPVIESIPPPCLSGFNYPDTVTTPSTCDGFTPNLVATDSYAGDYFEVAVTSGQTYKFTSSVASDYFTISTDSDATAVAFGTQPLTWVSTVTGNIRVHINLNAACGTEDVDRETSVVCGVACLTGTLYPTATYNVPVCDGTTVNVVATDSYAGEYSNINVFDSNDYIFSSSNATDYITVASADGLTPLAIGTGSVNFSPTADGVVRVYFHTNATCGAQATNRERRIVCTTALTVPQCASNPSPADGSTTVPAFATFDISWDAPTTGETPTSYDLYDGTSISTLVFDGNFTATNIPAVGPIGAYSTTIYWQIVPRNAAGAAIGCTIWSFTTEPQPTDTPDYVNLQWPPTITITQGGSDTVYGRVYEAGLTDVTSGQAPGILAWVGVSPLGDNSDPATWTNWTPATFNVEAGNDDEYQATIGAALAPGTYYYATRFTLNGGPFVYGGINASNNGNFWDGITYNSGVLTVNPTPPPANDECTGAIPLTAGGVFGDNDVSGTMLGATLTAGVTPSCQATNIADVWYTVSVPASGNLTIETQVSPTTSLTDTVVAAYTGTGICGGTLAQVGCDDDGGPTGPNGLMSILTLTGQLPGSTLYIGVWKYGTVAPNGTSKDFVISAYDGSLGNSSFDSTNFTYYPNPVKNILNLSYNQEITNVEVYNLLGQKVSSNLINANEAHIDMSNISKGAYMVKVTSNDQVKTIKVIKE